MHQHYNLRGTIEFLNDGQLIMTGDKVGVSKATLLNMVTISPFAFGLTVQQMLDNGGSYSAEVLNVTEEALRTCFLGSARDVAGVYLQTGYPTVASVPHYIIQWIKGGSRFVCRD